MVLAVIATGVLSGLGGMALALALHAIQHVAYGYGQAGWVMVAQFYAGCPCRMQKPM
ncbi:hypothetical protein KMAL_10860 [Novacetimonas maltaceti]|uniref:Uncharacterized protein n=2 Tax=Novacetimonas maltaceti TaxID=1203393 RepID=A0A2S3W3A6_9PROT|nr:hypothetical protein KMAL_10860 [Novacetimonas maltaceti]